MGDKPKKKKKKKKKPKTPEPAKEPSPEIEPEPENEPEPEPEPEDEPEPEPENENEEEPENEIEPEPEPEQEKEEEPAAEPEQKEEENLNKIGDISEELVVEYLKEHYKVHQTNIISPHEIAKNMMKSQGVQEAQFQFHLNQLGKVTFWIVNAMQSAFGNIEVRGQGFKLIPS